VVLAREHERLHDAAAVDRLGDLVGVLLDDREQVGEQLVLERRQVGGDLRRRVVRVRVRGAVDRPVGGDRDRAVRGRRAAGDRWPRVPFQPDPDVLGRGAGFGAAYAAAARIGVLVRNRVPSSRRCW
jgi:hypothetical protein